MKAYVILHGQTDLDLQRVLIGKSDPPLTDAGKEQAQNAISKLSDKGINMMLVAPQLRTNETAGIIAPAIGVEESKIVKGMKLFERDFGDYEGSSVDEVDMFALSSWFHNAPTPNGETVRETANRVIPYMNNMVKIFKAKTMLLVVSEHILPILFWFFKGLPQDGKESSITISDSELSVFEFDTDDIPQEIKDYQPVGNSDSPSGGGGDDSGRLLSQSEIDALIAEMSGGG